jgi:hypothetical protein
MPYSAFLIVMGATRWWRACLRGTLLICACSISAMAYYGMTTNRSAIPAHSGPACTITQFGGGHQPLGHQLESKMSCVLLSMLDPNRFKYVHTPFKTNASLETFMNLGSGWGASQFATKADRSAEIVIEEKNVNSFSKEAMGSFGTHCSASKEYVLESCWEILYSEPYVSHLDKVAVRDRLRQQYSLTTKPDTGFNTSKKNIVAYIRQQDTAITDIEMMFMAGLQYFTNRYNASDLVLWVETDGLNMAIVSYLNWVTGFPLNFPKVEADIDPLRTFHRMASADGLVFVPTSLSVAASLLSPADTVIVPMADHANHHLQLFRQSDRYTQINYGTQRSIGVLGFTTKGLVNMVYPVDKAGPCPLAVYGMDGFGHQLEGKLSCALLALIWPARFTYQHIPFKRMEHLNKTTPRQIEEFVNLGAGFPLSLLKMDPESTQNPSFRSDQLMWFHNIVRKVDPKCDVGRDFLVDNCWGITYIEPAVSRIDDVRLRLRELYLQSPKPETGFNTGKKNIVVHMRNGDAESQERFYGMDPSQFFRNGMNYYVNHFNYSEIEFWIETDDSNWQPVKDIVQKYPRTERISIRAPNPVTPVLVVFHRMVMADGMVMSPSSFSNSAAILSAAETLVIKKGFHGAHEEWMRQQRFVQLV